VGVSANWVRGLLAAGAAHRRPAGGVRVGVGSGWQGLFGVVRRGRLRRRGAMAAVAVTAGGNESGHRVSDGR
jgi:hypothetical protein